LTARARIVLITIAVLILAAALGWAVGVLLMKMTGG
jgi:hypothetical protein